MQILSFFCYLDHLIDDAARHPTNDKLAPARDAHPPKDAVGLTFSEA